MIYAKGDFCFIFIHLHCIEQKYNVDNATKESLLSWLTSPANQSMEVDSADKPITPDKLVVVPKSEMYLHLILYHLLTSDNTHEKALELANKTVEKMQAPNCRSMDAIAAKVWFAVDQAYELAGELSDAQL